MAFGLKTNDLRRVRNYEEAVETEANIVPIRGTSTKPLSTKRSKQNVTIRREGDKVIVRMYSTDLITYMPDGEIIVSTGGYTTQSTAAVIESVLRQGARCYGDRMWINLNAGWFVLTRDTRLRWGEDKDGWGGYIIQNPVQLTLYQINRKRANAMMKGYKPFMQYAQRMSKLLAQGGEVIVVDENTRQNRQYLAPRQFVEKLSGVVCEPDADRRMERYAELLQILMVVTSTYAFSRGYYTTSNRMQAYVKTHVYKEHAREILDAVPAPLGVMVKSKYDSWL
jgi:hypothetical protein